MKKEDIIMAEKKQSNMLLLDILKKYSDEDHHLTQQEIIRLLKSEYGMPCDRRSVKANVEAGGILSE